jgi:putative transposase
MKLAPQEIRTFFVTSVAHRRKHLFQSERMARLLLEVLEETRAKKRLLLHEFVLMPNHFHLLITPAHEVPLEKAIQFIKGGFSYRAKKELNFLWQIWERSFSEHRVKDADDYERCRAYILHNPVKAQLVSMPEEYRYSSASLGVNVDAVPPALKRTFHIIPFRGAKAPRFHR